MLFVAKRLKSAAMNQPVITVENLTYYYPGKKALEDVSFAIDKGGITALVGPNGSGKSTLLRSLAGLDLPLAGKIEIAGVNVLSDPRLAHTRIGYLSDDFGLYKDLAAQDVLKFIGGCHGFTGAALRQKLDWVTQTLRLESVLSQKCGTLSRGWRQRTGIAMAILHQPEVLLLDEPASGLDPEARAELSSIMRTLRDMGITSLVSSHILAELEEYCTSMLVLRNGRVQQHVSLQAHQQQQKIMLVITFSAPLTAEQKAVISRVAGQPATMANSQRTVAHLPAAHDPAGHHALLKALLEKGLPVCGFAPQEVSLQSLYLETAEPASRGLS